MVKHIKKTPSPLEKKLEIALQGLGKWKREQSYQLNVPSPCSVNMIHGTLQISIVMLFYGSIIVMEKMNVLMIGKLFCKNYRWNPGVVKQL